MLLNHHHLKKAAHIFGVSRFSEAKRIVAGLVSLLKFEIDLKGDDHGQKTHGFSGYVWYL